MIPLDSTVTIEANVTRAFKTSMEVYLDVWVEDLNSREKSKVNEAIYTFVAVDGNNKPTQYRTSSRNRLEKNALMLL